MVSNRGHECWLVGDAAKTDLVQLSQASLRTHTTGCPPGSVLMPVLDC